VNLPVPRLVAWELTRACNLRCRHCRANAEGGHAGRVTLPDHRGALSICEEDPRSRVGSRVPRDRADCGHGGLSFDEAKRVVDDIASFAQPILILTGGEPLLCPYLFDLIAYAREKGLKPVIGTNATLIDAAMARRIALSGVTRISVSIDFPTAAAHDAFRGVAGSFDAAVAGIRAARAAGVEVQINTTVTRLNRDLLEDIHALAVSLDVQALHPFLLVPTGRGADLSGEELSAEEYERTLRWVCERQKTSPLEFKPTDAPQYQRIVREAGGCGHAGRVTLPDHRGALSICAEDHCSRVGSRVPRDRAGCGRKGCLAGTGFCFIGHAGDVQPCGYFDLKLGNVRETPMSRIWAESPVLDDLRHPERLKGKCGICSFKEVCGGCRARALARTGDYLAEEPSCAHVPDQELLDRLQTDFPLVERPYAELGRALGISEEACYARALKLRAGGLIRRIGASFVPQRLGYLSTLVSAKVAEDRLASVASAVNAYDQVTHNYARDGAFNLWFTVIAASQDEMSRILGEIGALPGVEKLLALPSEKTYKLRAVFASSHGDVGASKSSVGEAKSRVEVEGRADQFHSSTSTLNLDSSLRALQGDILDRGLTPFSSDEGGHAGRVTLPGAACGGHAGRVTLPELRALLSDGTIRRFGAFANHRKAGFAANALVVWQVPSDRLDAAGAALAASSSVSHSYARTPQADWPYNLYAMVHARTADELSATCEDLSQAVEKAACSPVPRQVLKTVREFKKSSMRYFVV